MEIVNICKRNNKWVWTYPKINKRQITVIQTTRHVIVLLLLLLSFTWAGEQLFDLLIFWHILNGSIDFLSNGHNCALPFQCAVPPVHQPVWMMETREILNTSLSRSKLLCIYQYKQYPYKPYAKECVSIHKCKYALPKSLLVWMSIGRFWMLC